MAAEEQPERRARHQDRRVSGSRRGPRSSSSGLVAKRKSFRARRPDLHRHKVATLRFKPTVDFQFPLNQHNSDRRVNEQADVGPED